MRLAEFIDANVEPILNEWEVFARGIAPGAKMEALALRDHAPDILRAIVQYMGAPQRAAEGERSAGSTEQVHAAKDAARRDTEESNTAINGASDQHAIGRLGSGFDLLEVVSEYRALRASVLRLWRDSRPAPDERDVEDVTRFNESIDRSLTKAVSSFTKRVDHARDLFLGILSHDLRNPLNSIAVSAALLPKQQSEMAAQISTNARVMARMISDLLDYTRTRLGAGMPVSPAPMDLDILCRAVFNEYRTAHPDRVIRFHRAPDGDFSGEWDTDRLRQAISNLVGNAVQHGDKNAPIDVTLTADATVVTVMIHNGGTPIAPGELPQIFEPLVRGSSAELPKLNRPRSIGLGLYIAREVARSHGGTIDVTSTHEAGTAFTVRLPRHSRHKSNQPILDENHVQNM
jgi:signal transduction histidine kinase